MSDFRATVSKTPDCDLCPDETKQPAKYDGKTVYGPWAYMCATHFGEAGIGLGLGRGQILTGVELDPETGEAL